MKKLLAFALAVVALLCCLVGCNQDDIDDFSQPPSNLEFWIAENVDDVDFSNYQMKYGMFGGNMYYGTEYVPTLDEYNYLQYNQIEQSDKAEEHEQKVEQKHAKEKDASKEKVSIKDKLTQNKAKAVEINKNHDKSHEKKKEVTL